MGVIRFLSLLDRRGRFQIALLFGLSLVGSSFEVLGVSAVGPFVAIVSGSLVGRLETWSNLGLSHTGLVLLLGCFVWSALVMVQLIQLVALRLGCRFADEHQRLFSRRLYHRYLNRPFSWLAQNGSHQFFESMGQARAIHQHLYRPLISLAVSLTNSIFLLLLLTSLDPLISVLTIVVLGSTFAVLYFRCQAEVVQIGIEELRLKEEMMRSLTNVYYGLKPILLGQLSGRVVNDYDSQLAELARLNDRRTLLTELPRASIHSFSQAGLLLVVAWLYSGSTYPQEVLPKLGVVIAAVYRLIPCVQASLGALLTLRAAGPLLERLLSDLVVPEDSCPSSASPTSGATKDAARLKVEQVALRHVSYAYRGTRVTKPVGAEPTSTHSRTASGTYPAVSGTNSFSLRDCELQVDKGQRIAVVGRSGSGKSTLLQLLVGLLDSGGALQLNGQKLDSQNLGSYQSLVGYVSQDNVLVNGDVLENIAFLAEKPQDVEPSGVQKLASLVGLQQPLDFQVGPSGSQLSGGQRQRLGIAQALYRQPQILVLDEATNAMDLISESEIFEQIASSWSDMLLIVVTHRLESLMNFDCIYVVVDGQIVGHGRYQELLSECSAFKELCAATAETSR